MKNTNYTAIDLFSGAGGLHIGFENAGFEIKLCIDNSRYRIGTGLCIDWPQVETSLPFFNNL